MNCTNHEDRKATKVCTVCHKEYCDECVWVKNGEIICWDCKHKQKKRIITTVCVIGVCVSLLVAIIWNQTKIQNEEPPVNNVIESYGVPNYDENIDPDNQEIVDETNEETNAETITEENPVLDNNEDKSQSQEQQKVPEKTDENIQENNTESSSNNTVKEDTVQGSSGSNITIGQKNALKKADSYLSILNFSYQGLIEQLKYEGFTSQEATYAVDNCGANWNEQAVKKAKTYLVNFPFSYQGIIDQLKYDKFTTEQATYGADNCGANWNEQAAKKAASYLEGFSFSRQTLIDQLMYDGFTESQATYAASVNGL